MIFIDTHCHINDDSLFFKRKEIINEAIDNNVLLFIVPGWDISSSERAITIAHEFPNAYAAVGVHPENIADLDLNETLNQIKKFTNDKKVVAIGEVGLDYHYTKENKDEQINWFIKQIELANELGLPLIIHSRDASEDTLKILKENPIKNNAVLHCYSGSSELLQEFLKLGYYIGFDGPLTYKNSVTPKQNVVKCPLNRLLSETDSPYLPPVPYRGKENHPSYITEIVKKAAELREESIEYVTTAIENNVANLFHVGAKHG